MQNQQMQQLHQLQQLHQQQQQQQHNNQNNQHIEESFSHMVEKQGFNCADDRWHYGQDAHEYWADYLYPKVSTLVNQLL